MSSGELEEAEEKQPGSAVCLHNILAGRGSHFSISKFISSPKLRLFSPILETEEFSPPLPVAK